MEEPSQTEKEMFMVAIKHADIHWIDFFIQKYPSLLNDCIGNQMIFDILASVSSYTNRHYRENNIDRDICNKIKYLIKKYKFDINKPDNFGITPLHFASSYGNDINIVKMFLQLGATDTVDDNGRTVRNYWLPHNNIELTEQIIALINNPPRTYKEIEKNKLSIVLNKKGILGEMKYINQMLIGLGY